MVSSNDRVNSVDTKLELSLNNQLKLLSVSKSVTIIHQYQNLVVMMILNY
ncbi:hypothetical protein fh0823_20290 [Francisella halioticida]|nr:hypothetical protein [Francisella halioticida]BCD91890.1 hypothetical protein fh0823_20290 [Francisella halioticida]